MRMHLFLGLLEWGRCFLLERELLDLFWTYRVYPLSLQRKQRRFWPVPYSLDFLDEILARFL